MIALGSARRRSRLNAPPAFFAGILVALAEALLHPAIILVFFVSQLTDSLTTIALVVAVGALGWYLPQLFVPWAFGTGSRRMPWALGASIVRASSLVFLAYLGFRSNVSDEERLRSFFICFIAYSLASGFANTPVNETIAHSLPRERLERLLRQRNLWGMLLGVVAGLVARQTLGASGPDFPRNVSLLFVAAAAALSGAAFFIAQLSEPPSAPSAVAHSAPSGGDLVRAFGDGALRRYVLVSALAAFASLADPFYVVYAQRQFKLPGDMIGTFLALFAAGMLLSSPLWSLVLRLGGARGAIQAAIAVRLLAPLIVLLVPYTIDTKLFHEHVTNGRVVFYLLAAPFAVLGIATRGFVQGNFNYVLAIAVPERRSAYFLLALSPMLVAAAAPFAGVQVIDRWGFDRLFLVAVFAGFVSVLAAGMLASTNMRVRSVSRAWRLRDARS
jgi:hypothetical protein